MPPCSGCLRDGCRRLLDGKAEIDKHADVVEEQFGDCKCEQISVGEGTPGPVQAGERLFRLIVSPAGVDWAKRIVVGETTIGQVSRTGLSVFRDSASDADIRNLVIDRLARYPEKKPKTVQAIAELSVADVQSLRDFGREGRNFCLYDETVPRVFEPFAAPVPTHVTVLQRLPEPEVFDRKGKRKDGELQLIKLVQRGLLEIDRFRGGLLVELNEKSNNGEFIIQKH